MLRPGQFLQNRYEILELIGSGGMSDVYKARCHKLDRLVAIKVLKEELSWDATFVSKFKMEAQAAAGLSHPNIVSVYDVVDDGQLHYIVMELIEGITLKTYIARKGRLDVREAVGIAIQVAQGIAAAHEQNIIHRDIKPQNMIISKDGKVKVADFGIARVVSAQTQNAAAVGSVHYISPEQARGGYSDVRSDIYSLGITMYEMVTGRLPFDGDNTVAVAIAHMEEPITRPSIYEPDIPSSLENIILKCTEKKPERRYSSVNEVIADLRLVLLYPDGDFVERFPDIDYAADARSMGTMNPDVGYAADGRPLGVMNPDIDYMADARSMGAMNPDIGYAQDSRFADAIDPDIDYMTDSMSVGAMNHGGNYASDSRSAGAMNHGGNYAADARSAGAMNRGGGYAPPSGHAGPDGLDVIDLGHKPSYRPADDMDPEPDYLPQPPRGLNMSRGIERLLTGLGVLVAVVIVAVLILLFLRIGGLFRGGSGLGFGSGDDQQASQTETVPEETGTQLAETEILAPDATNLPVDIAEQKLKDSTLVMRVVGYEESDTVESDYVISQNPEAGSVVQKYSAVDVVVSTGNGKIDLAALSLTGMDRDAASAALTQNGLKFIFQEEYNDTVAQDGIIRYEPAEVREGETVTLYVSLGPAPVVRTVPDLSNITEEEALQRLADARLNPGDVTRSYNDTIPQGYVISQDIAANTSVEEGSRISFVVSDGPEPPPEPQRYIASISETYNPQGAFGPGMEGTSLFLEVRLRQDSEDGPQYRTLMETTEVGSTSLLVIDYPEIEAIFPGAEEGMVEVVNAEDGQVLASYPVQFTAQ